MAHSLSIERQRIEAMIADLRLEAEIILEGVQGRSDNRRRADVPRASAAYGAAYCLERLIAAPSAGAPAP